MWKSQHYSLPVDFDGEHKNKDKKKRLVYQYFPHTCNLFTLFDYKWTPKNEGKQLFSKFSSVMTGIEWQLSQYCIPYIVSL